MSMFRLQRDCRAHVAYLQRANVSRHGSRGNLSCDTYTMTHRHMEVSGKASEIEEHMAVARRASVGRASIVGRGSDLAPAVVEIGTCRGAEAARTWFSIAGGSTRLLACGAFGVFGDASWRAGTGRLASRVPAGLRTRKFHHAATRRRACHLASSAYLGRAAIGAFAYLRVDEIEVRRGGSAGRFCGGAPTCQPRAHSSAARHGLLRHTRRRAFVRGDAKAAKAPKAAVRGQVS